MHCTAQKSMFFMQYSLFIELLRRGYDTEKSMFYYRSRNDKEVDFVLKDGYEIRIVPIAEF